MLLKYFHLNICTNTNEVCQKNFDLWGQKSRKLDSFTSYNHFRFPFSLRYFNILTIYFSDRRDVRNINFPYETPNTDGYWSLFSSSLQPKPKVGELAISTLQKTVSQSLHIPSSFYFIYILQPDHSPPPTLLNLSLIHI